MRPCKMCGAVMKTRMILMIVILAPTAGHPTNVLVRATVLSGDIGESSNG